MLIPRAAELEKWSVIACDQFTSERGYWDSVRAFVGTEPSTLDLIVPEAYLNDAPALDMASGTNVAMDKYLDGGVFERYPVSFVYVERETSKGVRHEVVGMIDLEAYDFTIGSSSPVRASERTVAERLPARMLIREGARLELPHTIVLIDDAERKVIEPLAAEKSAMQKLYDFRLMEGGGRIAGWRICGEAAERLTAKFDALASMSPAYVIGDGNHSMAAAKELWNRIKLGLTDEERKTHPARFFLCEVVNVYDGGVAFEPIHRIIFGCEPDKLIETVREKLEIPGGREVTLAVNGERRGTVRLRGRSFGNTVEALQDMLDEYAADYDCTVDYIHDDASLLKLTEEEGSVGFLMPVMDKSELFDTVRREGLWPKKSFSIGCARDKRYYLEAREIR